jgi:hypothetical protein
VVAIQDGEQIFICSGSFQSPEKGLEYQATAPKVPPPEELAPMTRPSQAEMDKLPEKLQRWLRIERPFEFRPVQKYNPLAPVASEPVRQIWMRAIGKLPDDATLHQCMLAYISDYWLLDTSTMPHGSSFLRAMVMASIDHAIWLIGWRASTTAAVQPRQPQQFRRARLRARHVLLVTGAGPAPHKRPHTPQAVAVLIGAASGSGCRARHRFDPREALVQL